MTPEPTWNDARWELMSAALEFDAMKGDSLERLIEAAHGFQFAFTARLQEEPS